MGVGEFNGHEQYRVDEAIRSAEALSRYEFSVFVGRLVGEPRAFAEGLHRALVAPDRSVLVMLDPAERVLEIVTGADVRRHLTDREVELAALQMQGLFALGDLVGGLRRGIAMLAEHAVRPDTLHADQP